MLSQPRLPRLQSTCHSRHARYTLHAFFKNTEYHIRDANNNTTYHVRLRISGDMRRKPQHYVSCEAQDIWRYETQTTTQVLCETQDICRYETQPTTLRIIYETQKHYVYHVMLWMSADTRRKQQHYVSCEAQDIWRYETQTTTQVLCETQDICRYETQPTTLRIM
ncbi:hypothetical protein J6590_057552 [Homalodisca vitripennis]|nr:hypothetical protein J6590_057552 [Homalodisca vitripennis]